MLAQTAPGERQKAQIQQQSSNLSQRYTILSITSISSASVAVANVQHIYCWIEAIYWVAEYSISTSSNIFKHLQTSSNIFKHPFFAAFDMYIDPFKSPASIGTMAELATARRPDAFCRSLETSPQLDSSPAWNCFPLGFRWDLGKLVDMWLICGLYIYIYMVFISG